MHYARHDRFRFGDQWLSSKDGRTWKPPQASKNELRPVLNQIGPALDFRLGILMEQRPGFRTEPITSGTAGREIAEAQQGVAEYYFYVLRAWQIFLDAMFWAQTHGVAFVHVFVDKSRGPLTDDVELVGPDDSRYSSLVSLGYEQDPSNGALLVPLDESGNPSKPGTQPRQLAEGDLASRVVRASEVLADPEARTINGPHDAARWFLMRRSRDVKNARIEFELNEDELPGEKVFDTDDESSSIESGEQRWMRGIPAFPTALGGMRNRETVYEYNLYLAKNKELEDGAWLHIIGDKVIEQGEELPGGVIPFARFTDGSSDPQLMPRPVMSEWTGDQVAINALLAGLMQSARSGGSKILSPKNTLLEETYSKIIGSLLEYSGAKPDVISAVRSSPESQPLLQLLITSLENKTGWNDIARGQVSGEGSFQDVSGRALLGARELFERTFGPAVRAAAEGATEWASIVIKYAQYIFETPRLIPAVGRPDLAKMITKEKLGDRPVVYVDAQTLIPLPKGLRQQILLDHLEKGLISVNEYKNRSPYADIRNLTMGDTEQWERAQWINTLLEERWEEFVTLPPEQLYAPENGVAILWQDTPSVHKKALVEIILNERKPWGVRKLAADRWGIYDQLERAQMMPQQWPVPWEVVGAPVDLMTVPPPAVTPTGTDTAASAAAAPMHPAAASPTPEMAGMMPAAAGMQAAPLGSYGAVEEQAVEQSQGV